MKSTIAVAGLLALGCAATAQAEEAQLLPKEHVQALACTENLDITTTWGQCLGVIFAPCQTEQVGDAAHVACLGQMRQDWIASVEVLRGEVIDVIPAQGVTELVEMLGAWTGAAAQRCAEGAATRPEDMREAAQLGCEITEIVGLAEELAACVEGRSIADYCKREG